MDVAPREAESAGEAARRPVVLPLTFKGLIACLVLVLYGGLMAAYVLSERQALFRKQGAIDELQALEEGLKRGALAVSNALLALRQVTLEDDPAEATRDSAPFAIEAVEQALGPWRARLAGLGLALAQARRQLAALVARPSRAAQIELREAVEALGRELDREGASVRERRLGLAREFREHSDRIALVALALGLGGLAVFGGITALFFARLASDLGALGARARAIVSGYRGEPLAVTRRDEVGALMGDVNRLGADLARRERDLGLARELRAHREKMAALGAMARNLSHEIGNPLATIAAIAQEARAAPDAGGAGIAPAEAILRETQRIAEITRQIAEFSGPRSDAPEPVDSGAMLSAACDFMRYDARFRATRIEARVPRDLPVLTVVPDQLSEVLLNLLLLAVDADSGTASPHLEVEAAGREGNVLVRLRGTAPSGNRERRERTRQLVEGMGGRLVADREGAIEISLPGAAL